MSLDGFSIGDLIPLSVDDDDFAAVTVAVRNMATGHYLDFADNTFKAAGTAATQSQALTLQGRSWQFLWDSTGVDDGGALAGKQLFKVEALADGIPGNENLNLGLGGGGGGMAATDTIDGTVTFLQAMRAVLAFVAGKTSVGDASPLSFYRQDGTTAALEFTVDSKGTRSLVVRNLG